MMIKRLARLARRYPGRRPCAATASRAIEGLGEHPQIPAEYAFRLEAGRSGEILVATLGGNVCPATRDPPEQILTLEQWVARIHPEDRTRVQAELTRLLTLGGSLGLDCRTSGGEERWSRIVARPAWDRQKRRVVAVLGAVKDITVHRLAERDVLAAEERYRALVDHVHSGVAIYRASEDGSGFTLQDFNPAAERIEGIERSRVIGRDLLDVFPGARECGFLAALQRVHRTGNSERVAPFVYRDQERSGWRENHLYRLPNQDVVAIYDDVTDRVRAREALLESEEKLRVLIESMDDMVFTLDREQRHTGVYGVWLESAGLRPEDLLGKTAIEFYGPKLGAVHAAANRRALCGENAVYEWQRGSGPTVQFFQTSLSPLRNSEREVTGLVGVGRDISALKRAEGAVAAEKERLLVTLRSIADGVITTTVDGTITLMNAVAEELTGWPSEEAIGHGLGEVFGLLQEQSREPSADPAAQVIAAGTAVSVTHPYLLLGRDGSEHPIAHSGAPIRDAEGTILGVVIVFRDVTELRKTEASLRNAAKLEAIGVLAGGIAHDFNNLLSGLFGYIDLARDCLPPQHPAAELLQHSLAVFARARGLTQQLLTFSKGGRPHKRTMDLGPLIRNAVQFTLSGSNVMAEVTIAPALWPCDVDENQLAQVIDNLVLNARQSMPAGGTINVSAANLPTSSNDGTEHGSCVRISVSDTGVGIPRENLSRIFDPFFTTKERGTGLGLATAYSIVRQHAGLIEVESDVGRGSTFHVYLPAVNRHAPRGPSSNPSPAKGEGRVLVMDDEEFMRRVTSRMLVSLGYEARTVSNGAEAIGFVQSAVAEQQPFSVAILDLTIAGGLGGRETVERLRQIDPNLKVIASSGYSEDPVMAEPRAFGFAAKLPKPYTRADLAHVLATLFRKKS
jgi:PAS domain S-box-containing protein